MDHNFFSALLLLLLVLDPFGSLPIFISVMRNVDPARRTAVALRESGIAFGVCWSSWSAARASCR
jgi:small neutral amino acid transporter SnatA (MarC family)